MYVWIYLTIFLSLILPFMATAVMTHRSLDRRLPVIAYVILWVAGLFIAYAVSYHIVDMMYELTPTIILGPIRQESVEIVSLVCLSSFIVTWVAITAFAYGGTLSYRLMVAFIYSLICVAAELVIGGIVMHYVNISYYDDTIVENLTARLIGTAIIYAPLFLILPRRFRLMNSRTGGKMAKYLPIPILLFAVFIIGFYFMIYDGGISELDNRYSYLLVFVCAMCLSLLIGNLDGSISVSRYRTELDAASVVQMSCIPKSDAFENIPFAEVTASIEPAKEVGGDMYDIRKTADGNLVMSVADVSDKGVPAALFMMRTKVFLDEALESGLGPSECLSQINEKLMRDNSTFMFVTMILGVLSPTGEMRIACAGHPSPLLLHDGSVSEIKVSRGPILGLMEGEYSETVVSMSEGDVILMYSDGATDATDKKGEMFGIERLMNAFSETHGENVANSVDETIGHFSDTDRADDLTLVAARFVKHP